MKNNYSKWIDYTTSYSESFYEQNDPFSWPGFNREFGDKKKGNLKLVDIRNNVDSQSLFDNQTCPYCTSDLNTNYLVHNSIEWKRLDRVFCNNCGWWAFCFSKNKVYPFESFRNEFHEGVLYNFDFDNTDLPISALRKRILEKKINLRSISPKQLEILVGSVMRDYFDVTVHYVGGPGDNGIDLILTEGQKKLLYKSKEGKVLKVKKELEQYVIF